MPQRVLAELFGVSLGPISQAQQHIQPLLQHTGHHFTPTGTRLATLADLTAYAAAAGLTLTPKTKPAC